MILLDTNILSELMKVKPDPCVQNWFTKHKTPYLFTSSVSLAEISYGLHAMPIGKRRDMLELSFKEAILEFFKYRILSFDERAAHIYGKLMGRHKAIGRSLDMADGEIAAIAHSNGFALATRNIQDFQHCDLELINPFEG